MSQIPLSVLVVTKNAAEQLPRCLSALSDFNEVLVIDSQSEDGTKELSEKHKAAYIPYKWDGTYPKKRQWCLDKLDLKHNWVFFVDADEVITEELVQNIRDLFQKNLDQMAGFFINGQYVWNGQLLKHGLQNKKIALFHRHRMMFPEVDDLDCPGMGEIEGHYQPVLKAEGHIGTVSSSLLHYANHSQKEWLERHKRYAAWEICMNKKNAWPEDPISWRNTLKKLLRQNPFRPELAFLHSYLLKLGFLDGCAGYDFAKSRWRYYHMIRKASGHELTSIE